MKVKKNNGFVGIDMVIAIIALMIFSTLIITMIYNNIVANVKLKKDALAMIYITEIFENIAIADYANVTQDNKNAFIPIGALEVFNVNLNITNNLDGVTAGEDIIKKVKATLTYEVDGKNYSCSMERMKVKE